MPFPSRSCQLKPLPVYLAQHYIQRANDSDHVCHQLPAAHQIERLQIHKAWRTHSHTVRLRGTITDYEISQLALWRLDRVIDLSYRRLHHFRNFGHDGAFRDALDRLLNDPKRLPHLGHAYDVPVVRVAILAGRNFEIEILVVGVGQGFADVPLHAARAQHGAGHAERDAVFARDQADAFRPLQPDAVCREQFLVLVDLWLHERDEILDVFFKAVVRLVLQAADAEGVRREASAAILFKDLQDLFPV